MYENVGDQTTKQMYQGKTLTSYEDKEHHIEKTQQLKQYVCMCVSYVFSLGFIHQAEIHISTKHQAGWR